MKFYRVHNDGGKRKKFAVGVLVEDYKSVLKICNQCGNKHWIPDSNEWFNNKNWIAKMYMSREYYSDFAYCSISACNIISEKAKKILIENIENAVDFGDIQMVSLRDLTPVFLKYLRDRVGSREAKLVANDPPQYYRFLIKHGAELDFQKSNIELSLDCPKCGLKKYRSLGLSYVYTQTPYIIGATWNGNDIFHVEGLGNSVFCTEKFIEIYNENNLTGLDFEQVPVV